MAKGRLLVALFVGCGLVLGCSSSKTPARVSGTVKYKGQLLKGGTIRFHSPLGIYFDTIRSDGTYSITDMPAGEMVVTVETESANPEKEATVYGGAPAPAGGGMAQQMQKAGAKLPPPPGAPSKDGYVKIPARYNDPEQSGQKVTISAGSQTRDIDLPE
jgi:hypothetical protein